MPNSRTQSSPVSKAHIDESVPKVLEERGYAFDSHFGNSRKFTKLLLTEKQVQVGPNISAFQLGSILLLAEFDTERQTYRLGMKIDEREIVSPEYAEEDFSTKLLAFENALTQQ